MGCDKWVTDKIASIAEEAARNAVQPLPEKVKEIIKTVKNVETKKKGR